MTLKTIPSAILLCALVSPTPVSATIVSTYVFETVDSYDIYGDRREVKITGILSGNPEPSTITLTYNAVASSANGSDEFGVKRTFERCERFALMAMSKPGQYLLEMRQETSSGAFTHVGCKLTRR
ncbi:hypothetical protein F0U59_49525 [Archangium gephyra]|nr:hypothetical protein F0U59_49525 [Archangium gephyra]